MGLHSEIQQLQTSLRSMSDIWASEGGITHFVLSKVKMDPETSQCEAVPDIETHFDFYGIYAYTKEGTCYNVYDTSTNTQGEYLLSSDILRYLNEQLRTEA